MKVRCKTSEYWQKSFVYSKYRKTGRFGYVVGEVYNRNLWVVIWDGTKTTKSIHKEFVEIIKTDEHIEELKASEIF